MASWIDLKYIQLMGVHLPLFKQLRQDLWNFRCPICGDSARDSTKARGYIFNHKGDYLYKCQNCGDSRPVSSLIYIVSPELSKDYRLEIFRESNGGKTRKETKQVKHNRRSRKQKSSPVEEKKPIFVPEELKGMKPVSRLPEDHFVVDYVTSRMIPKKRWGGLFWCSNMRFIADRIGGYDNVYFDDFPRLLLPFINEDGELTHIQGRAIGDNVPKRSRYYTLEVFEAPKVYGMHRIDHSQPVKVVEGPIDSLFLTNCVGMGGSDVPWDLFDPKNTIFVWDNERRSKQIIKRMKEAVDRKFRVCVWGQKIQQKDINDMVKAGKNGEWIDDYITHHSYSGLRAKLAISDYAI